ncbi:type VI secretion system protein ImpL [Skermanella aerolata]|uniref:type VI secretion system membrane subunit TssM n=1 Tax=Skermanella aerolata TaxID=393310 RepID=UPI003D1E2B7F
MRSFKPVLAVVGSQWFLTLLGALILSLLVWYFGTLIGFGDWQPLAGDIARLLVILVILLVWAGANLAVQARRRQANAKLVSDLTAPAAQPDPGQAEVGELARRFQEALVRLRRSRVGRGDRRRWLYELPWYVMIGPMASGKTTALTQSGLRFPLGDVQELRGAGGTRYCDWLFTEEAVLIDTAGRYVSQDVDRTVDRTAWLGFLDLLRKHRPRQPLNGVIVAIPTDALAGTRADMDLAVQVRARLEELESHLGMRLPVYLMVSKSDLVAGFSTFFRDLDDAGREQVWGVTFPHQLGTADAPDMATMRNALSALTARLDKVVPERLAAEGDLARRAEIFAFPAHFAQLGEDVVRFVERCFRSSAYETGGWLRGVYFTSGTQVGTPIDRLVADISARFAIASAGPSAQAGDRSFFLTRMLKDVVFGEASLVGRDPVRERREHMARWAALAAVAAVTVLITAAWTLSYIGNREQYDALEADIMAWSAKAGPLAKSRLTLEDADYIQVLPLLDEMVAIEDGLKTPNGWRMGFGLSQRESTLARVEPGYRNALNDLLLPRLVLSSERSLRQHLDQPDYVIEGLKTYLMLGGIAPVDPAQIQAWFTVDTENHRADLAPSAARHTEALARLLPTVDPRPVLDATLQADARAVLARIPLAKRAYDAVVDNPDVTDLPGWRLTDNAGPNAQTALVRRSGLPLDTEIPAIYTYQGFHELFLPLLDEGARSAWAELWVLSGRGNPNPGNAEIERLKQDMLRLYYDDAIASWEELLRDVTVAPVGGSLNQAVEVVRALSGTSSPLVMMTEAVIRETKLTEPPQKEEEKSAGDVAAEVAAKKIGRKLGKLGVLVKRQHGDTAPAAVPGKPVEDHFAYLRKAAEGDGSGQAPLQQAVARLGDLHARLADATRAANPEEALRGQGTDAGAQLAQAAKLLPPPLDGMLSGVAASTGSLLGNTVTRELNAAWRSEVLPFCRTALNNRFPFDPNSDTDANLEDMTRLFAPGGLIDGFVKQRLAPYLDMSRRPWRDARGIGLSQAALGRLVRASGITDALFPTGKAGGSFVLTPRGLDSSARSLFLSIDGQELTYDHGPAQPVAFTWPGPKAGQVRLSFARVDGETPATAVEDGPWALFRMLRKGQITPSGQPDQFEVVLQTGNHEARFSLRAGSVKNPFDPTLLRGFSCPEAL